jgi:Sulfotransferase family
LPGGRKAAEAPVCDFADHRINAGQGLMTQSRLLKHALSDDGNLRLNRKHQAAASHALQVYGSGAIYTFIPKNACSTMRLSLAIANGCIADASGLAWIHDNNETFRADLRELVRATYTFVILRDPFARLASCFLDKIVSQARPARQLRELVEPDLDLDDITFADFVMFLNDAATREANMHWRPQTSFLVYEHYDDYFAVETFAEAAATIRNRAGLEVVDARPLTAHGLDRYRLLSSDIDHSTTPVREIARLKCDGDCPAPRSLFTPSIVDSVARLYADDIRLYADRIGLPTLFPTPPPA